VAYMGLCEGDFTLGPTVKEEAPFDRYRVNLRAIDSAAVSALRWAQAAGQIIVIDEIGPMGMLSELLCQTVLEILAGEAVVLGTIVERSHRLADRVRRHPRVRLRPVTPANRDELPARIAAELGQIWLG